MSKYKYQDLAKLTVAICLGLMLCTTALPAMETDNGGEYTRTHSAQKKVRDPEERSIIRRPRDLESTKRYQNQLSPVQQESADKHCRNISLSGLMGYKDN